MIWLWLKLILYLHVPEVLIIDAIGPSSTIRTQWNAIDYYIYIAWDIGVYVYVCALHSVFVCSLDSVFAIGAYKFAYQIRLDTTCKKNLVAWSYRQHLCSMICALQWIWPACYSLEKQFFQRRLKLRIHGLFIFAQRQALSCHSAWCCEVHNPFLHHSDQEKATSNPDCRKQGSFCWPKVGEIGTFLDIGEWACFLANTVTIVFFLSVQL